MSGSDQTTRGASPFSRGAVLGIVLVSFTAFLAMIYFISVGDTGGPQNRGAAHAYANGLNGYSGFVELLEAEGFDVTRSRGREGLDTNDLLILTPPQFADPEEITSILESRQYVGPTLVILPKWIAGPIDGRVAEQDRERAGRDWVTLLGANPAPWTTDLPEPFTLTHSMNADDVSTNASWRGFGLSGRLPTPRLTFAQNDSAFEPLVTDPAGRALVVNVVGDEGTEYYSNAHWTMFVAEPDLVNNFGLADATRAAAAIALVREAGYGDMTSVTFDLTLNGYGGSVNLLTLAFQPPFLAATLCLILAILIVGWRAFLRFGPPAASSPEIAFGKKRLVSNGAGLIVRARRLGLLGKPYVALIERKLARLLGLTKPDIEAIDAALLRRLPSEEPFSIRAARMENADRPADILRAARALNELTDKLGGKPSK